MAGMDDIRQLRESTGAGIMDCKKALDQSGGDHQQATALLREWGLASAAKKAGREASQGVVESYVHGLGRVGVLVEVNCETDFVARTDAFKALAHDIAMQIAAMNPSHISPDEASGGSPEAAPLLDQAFIKDSSKTIRDLVNENIATLRENIVIRRFARFELGGQ